MKNKLLIPLIIVSVCGLTISGSLSGLFIAKQVNYNQLSTDYETLIDEYSNVDDNYQAILNEFGNLTLDYQSLLVSFEELVDQYDLLVGENADLQDALDQLTNMYNTLQNALTNLQSDYDALTQDYNDLVSDYNDLSQDYSDLLSSYNALSQAYDALLIDFNTLTQTYNTLLNDYAILTQTFDDLLDSYNDLLAENNSLTLELNALKDAIRHLALPVQYSVFAEAVRRYYMPLYLDGLSGKDYWMAFAEYCRDVILHDSYQENSFIDVSNAFADCLMFGTDTMSLANYIMANTFDYCNTIDYWGLDELSGLDEFTILETVVNSECIAKIDYEYDSDITLGQEFFAYDYIKFPVETAFRTMGDCEDQAILLAAYLESCGFETMILISHDPAHPVRGAFYHGSLMVHIEDTTLFNLLYPATLWSFGVNDPYFPDYTWCWLDPTWDIPFGQIVPWVEEYDGSISDTVISGAICDIDGFIM